MRFRVLRFFVLVGLLIAFFPVRLVSECSYSGVTGGDLVGTCSDAGVSLIGITIPTPLMGAGGGVFFVALLLAPFLYVGYRMDRRHSAGITETREETASPT